MFLKRAKIKLVLYFLFLLLLFPERAYAYLDPGSGSFIFQMLIAGFLSSTFFFKSAFKKIKKFFANSSRKKFPDHEDK